MKPHIKQVYCDDFDNWMWYCQGGRHGGWSFTPAGAYELWRDHVKASNPELLNGNLREYSRAVYQSRKEQR